MKGLLKNNFYATLSNVKVFSIIMFLFFVFVIIIDNRIPLLIISYMLLGMVGFSFNFIASLRKESVTKWSKYKLTVPVKRSEIVQSYFLSLFLWLVVGMIFAGIGVAFSVILHGFPFDRNTDIFMMFVVGVGISLFMGTIFFPLFYLGGEERSELFLVISLLSGVGFIMVSSTCMNILFPEMNNIQIILCGVVILMTAFLMFVFSYLLTVYIYQKKEY